jgi:hypothetical protein
MMEMPIKRPRPIRYDGGPDQGRRAQSEPAHREDLVQSLQNTFRDAGGVAFEALGEIADQLLRLRRVGSDEVTLRNYWPVGRRKGNMSLSDPLAADVVVDLHKPGSVVLRYGLWHPPSGRRWRVTYPASKTAPPAGGSAPARKTRQLEGSAGKAGGNPPLEAFR